MKFINIKNRSGFTLVEIMVVILIIAILIAIAVPRFVDIAQNAEHAVWKYNSTYVVKVIALNIFRYDGEERYAAPTSGETNYSESSLNNFLEKELENYQVNSNKDSIRNLKSGSKKILHGDNPVNGTINQGKDPAVFITGNALYSHTGGGSTNNLIGAIVTYLNQADPYNVQVYYIDRDGNKSELIADFD